MGDYQEAEKMISSALSNPRIDPTEIFKVTLIQAEMYKDRASEENERKSHLEKSYEAIGRLTEENLNSRKCIAELKLIEKNYE